MAKTTCIYTVRITAKEPLILDIDNQLYEVESVDSMLARAERHLKKALKKVREDRRQLLEDSRNGK